MNSLNIVCLKGKWYEVKSKAPNSSSHLIQVSIFSPATIKYQMCYILNTYRPNPYKKHAGSLIQLSQNNFICMYMLFLRMKLNWVTSLTIEHHIYANYGCMYMNTFNKEYDKYLPCSIHIQGVIYELDLLMKKCIKLTNGCLWCNSQTRSLTPYVQFLIKTSLMIFLSFFI